MEKVVKHILFCGLTPDDAQKIHGALKNEFKAIRINSLNDIVNHSGENSLLLFDRRFLDIHSVSTISELLKGKEWPAVLLLDHENSDGILKTLEELDISHTIIKYNHYLPVLVYSIKRTFDDFFLKKKMRQALFQIKTKLDETQNELETTKKKLSAGTVPGEKVDILEEIVFIFKRGEIELPSHPKLSSEFRKLMDTGASLQKISGLLRRDAAISTKLISISNSPYYRGMSNNKTLEQSIGRLGLDTTKQQVDVILNRTLYMSKLKDFVDIIEKLWEHSLSCAYASQFTAQRLQINLEDDAFTLGLLHDIGKLVILQTVGELRKKKKLGDNLDQSELFTTITNYHGKFGASLLKRWKFSQEFIHTTAFHNNLAEVDPVSKALLVVHFSNLLVKTMGYSLVETDGIDLEKEQSTTLLELTTEDIQAISQQVGAMMDEFRGIFA